jgi:hypothetical protein
MPAGTHSREEWTAIASGLDLRRGGFIDGELVDAASGLTFDRINPATGLSLRALDKYTGLKTTWIKF